MKLILLTFLMSLSLYSRADTSHECNYANNAFKDCLKHLSKKNCDSNVIEQYTLDLYQNLNMTLRGQINYSNCMETAELLKSALAELPKVTNAVYRGASLGAYLDENLALGTCITEKAFMSTSLVKEQAEFFAKNALLVIESKSGRNISTMSQSAHEAEILFLPNIWLKLKNKTKKDKYVQFEFEEVEKEDCSLTE